MDTERPWHRPGATRYALARLRGFRKPPVTVHDAPDVVVDNDQPVSTRDGTVLRVNVYRPKANGPWPVILCAHPYGKDNLPTRKGRRLKLPVQYRAMRQTTAVTFSEYTSWEAPDPAYWTAHGYVVVNADLRGSGTSDGVGTLLSAEEGRDVADLIGWAADQRCSTGDVGMIGVSYLAISECNGAAQQPPALRCIVPWEGFTDPYRDLCRPGGVRENGFLKMWSGMMKARETVNLAKATLVHPTRDDWWQSLMPNIDRINVPALLCTSFSDNNLHSRGTFRALHTISSTDRFAWTHRVLRLDALLGITITGLVFDLILIKYVHPSGWQLVATIGFHYVAPWATPARMAAVRPPPPDRPPHHGLGLPLAGGLDRLHLHPRRAVHWYPYPFLDVDEIGYWAAFRNTLFVVVLAVVLVVVFTFIDRFRTVGATPRLPTTGSEADDDARPAPTHPGAT